MLKKLTHAAMALALVAGASIATAQDAEARRGYRAGGVVAGTIIGLGILGAYAASRDRGYYAPNHYSGACYAGRPVCRSYGQVCGYNRYGEYRCADDVRCTRPTVCD